MFWMWLVRKILFFISLTAFTRRWAHIHRGIPFLRFEEVSLLPCFVSFLNIFGGKFKHVTVIRLKLSISRMKCLLPFSPAIIRLCMISAIASPWRLIPLCMVFVVVFVGFGLFVALGFFSCFFFYSLNILSKQYIDRVGKHKWDHSPFFTVLFSRGNHFFFLCSWLTY